MVRTMTFSKTMTVGNRKFSNVSQLEDGDTSISINRGFREKTISIEEKTD